MVLLKDRGLLEGDYNVNMEPITTTVVNPDEVATNPAVDGTTPAATSTSSAVSTASIASTENVDGAKTVETAVMPKMEVTPNVQSAMSKLLAEKEKENQSGVLSWYKPYVRLILNGMECGLGIFLLFFFIQLDLIWIWI